MMLRFNVAGCALLPILVWLSSGCTAETLGEEPVDVLEEPIVSWGAQSNPPNGWIQFGSNGYVCEGFEAWTGMWHAGKAVWNGSMWVCAYYRSSTDAGMAPNMWGLMNPGPYMREANTGQPIPWNVVRTDSGIPVCVNGYAGYGGTIPGKVTGSGSSARCKFVSAIITPIHPYGWPASTATFDYVTNLFP